MKKFAIIVAAMLLFALIFTGCAQETVEPADGDNTPDAGEVEVEVNNELTWLAADKLYLDYNCADGAITGFELKVDGNAVSNAAPVAFTSASTITFKGESTVPVTFILIYEFKESGVALTSTTRSGGIKAGSGEEGSYLELVVKTDLDDIMRRNPDKIYICITDSADGWNHSLSEKLNETLQAFAS